MFLYNEWSINHFLCCKHSLTGSPRFCTTFRQSSRDIVNILESIVNSYIMSGANGGNAVTNDLFELLLDILTDDKFTEKINAILLLCHSFFFQP